MSSCDCYFCNSDAEEEDWAPRYPSNSQKSTVQEAVNLLDIERWSNLLLERVSGTEYLKLNVVAGGVGGAPFNGIDEISKQHNIPPNHLQLSKIRVALEPSQLTKFIRLEFKNTNGDVQAPLLWTSLKGEDSTHCSVKDCNILNNQITRISGSWGSYEGQSLLYNCCIEQMSIGLKNGDEVVRGNRWLHGTLPFNIQAPSGYHIANIYGRSGASLDQIGVYLKADRSLQWSPQAHSNFPEQFKRQIRTFLLCIRHLYDNGDITGMGSLDIISKIANYMLLECGMTVKQYRDMARSLVFNQALFREKFAMEFDN